MTQVDLAAGDVTAAYISRIEVGQRRPHVQLLYRMAGRMGTTLHQLLTGMTTHEARQLELVVEHAAVALALGEPQAALENATTAVERLADFGDAALSAEAMRVKAEARRALGDVDGAIDILEQITQTHTPDVNTLRSLITLCRCYCERDEPARAITIGDLAYRMAGRLGLDGLSDALHLAAARAEAHLVRGDRDVAAQISRAALAAAALDESHLAEASAYWHASVSEALANGATPAALELARTAHVLIDIAASRSTAAHLARVSRSSTSASPRAAAG